MAWSVLMYFSIVILPVFHVHLFLISFPILLTSQSLLDFAVSVILLLKTLTVKNTNFIHNSGLHGEIECRLWNTELFLWGLIDSSTWNLVQITIERLVVNLQHILHHPYFTRIVP